MTKAEGIELAITYAKQRGIAFSGVKSVAFADHKVWAINESEGDSWYVFFSLIENPFTRPDETVAVRVCCRTGEAIIPDSL